MDDGSRRHYTMDSPDLWGFHSGIDEQQLYELRTAQREALRRARVEILSTMGMWVNADEARRYHDWRLWFGPEKALEWWAAEWQAHWEATWLNPADTRDYDDAFRQRMWPSPKAAPEYLHDQGAREQEGMDEGMQQQRRQQQERLERLKRDHAERTRQQHQEAGLNIDAPPHNGDRPQIPGSKRWVAALTMDQQAFYRLPDHRDKLQRGAWVAWNRDKLVQATQAPVIIGQIVRVARDHTWADVKFEILDEESSDLAKTLDNVHHTRRVGTLCLRNVDVPAAL